MEIGKRIAVMGWAAFVGFALAWALLGATYSEYLRSTIISPAVSLAVCPASLIAVSLENASQFQVIYTWLLIATLNSALYGALGMSVTYLWKSD